MRHLFYHYDLDGRTAGSAAHWENGEPIDEQLHEVDYDHYQSVMDMVKPKDIVVMVDYSFKPKEMLWLQRYCSVTWIDHHVSAIKDSKKFGYDNILGLREIGLSGAELAWKWFQQSPIPEYVKLVGEYDTFRSFDKDPDYFLNKVVPFYYGAEMNMDKLVPSEFKPSYMTNMLVGDYLAAGEIIKQYKIATGKALYSECSYVKELWGYKCLCVNTPEQGSLFLTMTNVFDPKKHDLMFTYSFNGQKWCYGWYTDGHPEVDCSAIAKQYGGGGHQGAAGACSEKLIDGVL